MALALKSGLTPERGLEFSRNLIEDPFYLARIDQCCAEIEQGTEFSTALVKTKVFTGVYARMTAIAGKSGMMDEVMEQIADRCEEELNEHITSFLAVLEPTLVIILSVKQPGACALAGCYPVLCAGRALPGDTAGLKGYLRHPL